MPAAGLYQGHAPNFMAWGLTPFGGCTHLGARCARGTLGTGSAGVTLLPGLSLLAFGTRLSVGALRPGESGRRERGEDAGCVPGGGTGLSTHRGAGKSSRTGGTGLATLALFGTDAGVNGGDGGSAVSGITASAPGAVGVALTGAPRAPAAPDGPGGPDSPWKREDGEVGALVASPWGALWGVSVQPWGCPGSHLLAVGASGAGGTDGTRQTLQEREK